MIILAIGLRLLLTHRERDGSDDEEDNTDISQLKIEITIVRLENL